MTPWARWRWTFRVVHPARAVVVAFAVAVVAGTLLLLLPGASADGSGASPLVALFTATSAVCVTGLVVVDTPSFWSPLGEGLILALIQVGGFGIMTLASLLGLVVSRRLGLRLRMTAQAETRSVVLGDLRQVLLGVLRTTIVFEGVTAALLAGRFALGYGEPTGRALYLGAFHAVSAFNNAGFALFSDSFIGFVGDPWLCLPLAGATIAGGLGFPVLFELRRELRTPWRWSLHTRVTLVTTALLLVAGTVAVLAFEWGNRATVGAAPVGTKLLAAFFQSVMPRTAGFQSIDYAVADEATLVVTDVLMFIGGGSASTAGGIKVTTFALLGFVILAELRGDREVHALGRRVAPGVQRQALTVALLGVAAVVAATLALLVMAPFELHAALFEATSAFSTVGLSTGITGTLSGPAQLSLVALMFLGRLGPLTLGSALALRERPTRYRLPEERPIVG